MKTKLNTTSSMSSEIENGAIKLYSYNTVMGYIKNGKAVLVNGGYSMTTAKHLSKYRDMYSIDREQTYEYKAFIKRAELDNVKVLGGWNE
tara:strand:- start:121 stop:390 length:270 start_codon:yes stop_codon:yes gene_type:complete